MSGQLTLPVADHDAPAFSNFRVSRANRLTVNSLHQVLDADGFGFVWLWGSEGCGRTHLLQACCAEFAGAGSVYLPLSELHTADPFELLSDLESYAIVALDDVDMVFAKADWERALFDLFNRCLGADTILIMSAALAAAHADVVLPDLQSRLVSGLSLSLQPPDDDEKAQILIDRARSRGMQLTDAIATFILNRAGRDLKDLLALLDEIDRRSLRDQRRLTIPFVRQVLDAVEQTNSSDC